jgi:hypothetical protein
MHLINFLRLVFSGRRASMKPLVCTMVPISILLQLKQGLKYRVYCFVTQICSKNFQMCSTISRMFIKCAVGNPLPIPPPSRPSAARSSAHKECVVGFQSYFRHWAEACEFAMGISLGAHRHTFYRRQRWLKMGCWGTRRRCRHYLCCWLFAVWILMTFCLTSKLLFVLPACSINSWKIYWHTSYTQIS